MAPELTLKELDQKWGTAHEVFKKANDERLEKIEKGLGGVGETQTKLDKIEKDLDKFDKAWEARVKKEVADRLAAEQGDNPEGESKEVISKRKRAFIHMCRKGYVPDDLKEFVVRPQGDEAKGLAVGNDPAAGYLAPPEFIREILKGEIEFSPLRSLSRVFQISSFMAQIPKKTGSASAAWVAELGTRSDTTGSLAWSLEQCPVHELQATIPTSRQQLEDSVFNIESLISEEGAEQFGLAEGTAFYSGDGVGKPQGVTSVTTTNLETGEDTTGHLLKPDDLIDALYALKEPYQRNATFLHKRVVLGKIRKMKNTVDGTYLMAPLREGMPPTILGRPYMGCDDMLEDGTAAGRICGLVGDFRRGYGIVDRIAMTTLRDPYTSPGQIKILMWKRVGGQVILPEAITRIVTG
jgi:HK97 family phage major capsid protein